MTGVVHSIWIASDPGAATRNVPEARLEAGAGIVGDRHHRTGHPAPAEELTLISSEEIDAFNQRTGLNVGYGAARRNIVTAGLPLNDLVGRRFTIGSAEAEGLELCEPCGTLGRLLAVDGLSPREVIRELRNRGGLRARIRSSGVIRSGDAVTPIAEPVAE